MLISILMTHWKVPWQDAPLVAFVGLFSLTTGFFCRLTWHSRVYPSWMYILDTVCFCLPSLVLLCTRSRNCTPFKSDVAFVSFSFAPPAWVLLRHNFCQAPSFDHIRAYKVLLWYFGAVALACRSFLFATQAAIQAGCSPFVCFGGFLFTSIIFVATASMHWEGFWKVVWQSDYVSSLLVSLAAWRDTYCFFWGGTKTCGTKK